MRVTTIRLGLVLLAAVYWFPAHAALNHNRNSIKALSNAYGFLLGQEYSLKRIEKAYPSLRLQVEAARLKFESTFLDVKDELEQELSQAIGASNLRKLCAELEKQLGQLLGQQTLTPEIAQQFLEQVKARAKGGEMEPDVLRYLLAVKYAKAPSAEFSDGFRQSFSTDGTGKAQGIKLRLQLPQSWLAEEGERPHIVKQWTSEGGTGLSIVNLQIRDLEGQAPSSREIEQFVTSGEARQTLTDLGKVYEVGTFTVERRKGYWVELSMIQERVGVRIYQRGMFYQLFFRGKAIGVMCMAGSSEREVQKLDASASLIKPLCQQVVNSLVLEQAY
ncbi:MAG: hypothetical protein P9C48_10015 [Defluviicoccus sp.]|nr:hypothetical protein [Defluviicoccus sp.]MDG4609450.1 hypothetical protein [Defluviicoccus sp.]